MSDGYIIEPVGGLGNQLFQFALGMRMSQERSVPLYVDRWWYRTTRSREFILEAFDSPLIPVPPSKGWRYGRGRLSIAIRTPLLAGKIFPGLYAERHQGFDADVLAQPPGTRFLGYFQSWKYFDGFGDAIRACVRSVRSPSHWFTAGRAPLPSSLRRVSVHVRRGDYAVGPSAGVHSLLDEAYYMRSMELVGVDSQTQVSVFSDCPQAAQSIASLVEKNTRARVCVGTSDADPLELMLVMADCDAIVCANSTFSWWAAYLEDRPGRAVVVPEAWFAKKSVSTSDRFPPCWRIT